MPKPLTNYCAPNRKPTHWLREQATQWGTSWTCRLQGPEVHCWSRTWFSLMRWPTSTGRESRRESCTPREQVRTASTRPPPSGWELELFPGFMRGTSKRGLSWALRKTVQHSPCVIVEVYLCSLTQILCSMLKMGWTWHEITRDTQTHKPKYPVI